MAFAMMSTQHRVDQFQLDGVQQGKILIQKCLSCSTLGPVVFPR